MHNIICDMDLQTQPPKIRSNFLAMTSSPAGICLCALAGGFVTQLPNTISPSSASYGARLAQSLGGELSSRH